MDWVSQKFSSAWQGISNLWAQLTTFFPRVWTRVKNAFDDGIAGIVALVLNWSPLGLFQQVFSTVLSWFGIDIPNQFTDFGKNMIDGLVNGIRNAWEGAKQIVSELGDGIKGSFAEKLGIHSPSRVFKGYGVNVVEGLAIGMGKAQPLATEASQNLSSAVQFDPVLNSVETTFKSNSSADYSPLKNYQPLNKQTVTHDATAPSGMVVNFNPTINLSDNPNQTVLEQVKQGINMSLIEFERLLERVLDQRQRRAY